MLLASLLFSTNENIKGISVAEKTPSSLLPEKIFRTPKKSVTEKCKESSSEIRVYWKTKRNMLNIHTANALPISMDIHFNTVLVDRTRFDISNNTARQNRILIDCIIPEIPLAVKIPDANITTAKTNTVRSVSFVLKCRFPIRYLNK